MTRSRHPPTPELRPFRRNVHVALSYCLQTLRPHPTQNRSSLFPPHNLSSLAIVFTFAPPFLSFSFVTPQESAFAVTLPTTTKIGCPIHRGLIAMSGKVNLFPALLSSLLFVCHPRRGSAVPVAVALAVTFPTATKIGFPLIAMSGKANLSRFRCRRCFFRLSSLKGICLTPKNPSKIPCQAPIPLKSNKTNNIPLQMSYLQSTTIEIEIKKSPGKKPGLHHWPITPLERRFYL